MKYSKLFLFLFFISFYESNLLGQANNNLPATLSLIPPGPEAAALNKYIDNPVNYYTGVPQISYPIYNLKVGNFSLPISLNYHAGGHKVDDIATCVGLGWSLNATGQISRTLAGLPDEEGGGFLHTPASPTNYILERSDEQNVIGNYSQGLEDSEPDYFYLNALGISSKFVLDKETKKANFFPWINAKLETPFETPNPNSNIWKMTSSDGTIYFFTEIEQSNSYMMWQIAANAMPYISAWNLTKVILPNLKDSITFEYINNSYDYFTNYSETQYIKVSGVEPKSNFLSFNRVIANAKVVSKIKFPSGEVNFIYSDINNGDLRRCDMQTAKYLKKVVIKNSKNNIVKEANLHYSLFDANNINTLLQTSCTTINKNDVRLKLDSVSDVTNSNRLTTKFIYNTNINLPNRIESKSLDHWGFYNGEDNFSRVPHIKTNYYGRYGQYFIETPNSNNKPSIEFTKANILEKIIYPTSGNVNFEYEQNECESPILNDNNELVQNQTVIKQNVNSTFSGFSTWVLRNYTDIEITPINVPENSRLLIKIYDGNQALVSNRLFNNYPNTQVDPLDPYTITIPFQNFSVTSQLIGPGGIALPPTENIFNIKWYNEENKKKKKVGGLRIKSIKSFDAISLNPVSIREFDYTDNTDPTKSSGRILGVPNYISYSEIGDGPNVPRNEYYNVTSQPINSSGYMQGSVVGYKRVLVKSKDAQSNNNGATEHFFTTAEDYMDLRYESPHNIFGFPFIGPEMQNEWMRGNLLKSIDYKLQSSQLVKVKEIQNVYKIHTAAASPTANDYSNKTKIINAGKGTTLNPHYTVTLGSYNIPVKLFEYFPYRIYTGSYSFLQQSKEMVYNENGVDKIEMTTKNTINDDVLVVETEIKDSKNEVQKSTVKYPKEMVLTNNDPTGTYQAMINRNMIALPIEQKLVNHTLTQELSKSVTTYSNWHNTFYAPALIQSSTQGASLQTDVTIQLLDERGNVLQGLSKAGVTVSYIYGYNSQYPVAQIIGAEYNTCINAVNQTVLNNPLTSDSDIRTELNNLRSALLTSKAQIVTMTYEPLIGITSQTDANGRTLYYEYDSFNRLSTIKNQDGKIVKKICYKYDGQLEECGQ